MHISKKNIGDIIVISGSEMAEHGHRIVRFFESIPELHPQIKKIIDENGEITDEFLDELSNKAIDGVNLNPILKELVLEKKRREIDSNLPSRFNSIFLCKKKDIAKWVSNLNASSRPIYEVIMNTKKKHEGDEFWWNILNGFDECAEKYWTESTAIGPNHLHEIVFQGQLTIINKYENYDEFKQALNEE